MEKMSATGGKLGGSWGGTVQSVERDTIVFIGGRILRGCFAEEGRES